jgi:type IV secretory pathway VirB10-like protein
VVSDSESSSQSTRDRDLAAELRLRPERPPVTRLSPRVLIALATVAAISVSGALIWALYQGQRKTTGTTELYNTENNPTPDGLTTLPRDYTGLPRGVPPLGPPLPGDLGRRSGMRSFPDRRSPASMPSSSASRKKRKRHAPAVCSPRPTQASVPRQQSRCRRPQRRTRQLQYRLEGAKGYSSIPTRSSTCRTARSPS